MRDRKYISDKECMAYIIHYLTENESCKNNLLSICEWLLSVRGAKCYKTEKRDTKVTRDIRFDYEDTTDGMFFGIACQKSSARIDLYVGTKDENDLPEYVKLNDNPSRGFARVSGKDTQELSLNQLKKLITDSFTDRFGKKMPQGFTH